MHNTYNRGGKICKGIWVILVLLTMIILACSGLTSKTSEKASNQLSLVNSVGQGIAQAADWSPDGKTFAIGTSDNIDLYDATIDTIIYSLDTGKSSLFIKYSPNSQYLSAYMRDGSVQIWDLLQQKLIHTFSFSEIDWAYELSFPLSFSADSSKLAVSDNRTVSILDVAGGNILGQYPGYGDAVVAIEFNTKGDILLASSSHRVTFRDLTTGDLLPQAVETEDDISNAFFDKTGSNVITVSNRYSTENSGYLSFIRVCDFSTGKVVKEYQATGNHIGLAVTDLSKDFMILYGDNKLDLWDMSINRKIKTMPIQDDWVSSISFSKDGELLLLASSEISGYAQIWNLDAGYAYKVFDQYSLPSNYTTFSSNGQLVASVGAAHEIVVKDANSGTSLYTIRGGRPMAFNPDGSILAYATPGSSGSEYSTEYSENTGIRFINAETGKRVLDNFTCSGVSALAFSPNGNRIAFGGNGYESECNFQIRDVVNGELRLDLSSINEDEYLYAETITYSPDGKLLLLQGYDLTILNANTGEMIRKFDNTWNSIATFSPDSRYLAICGIRDSYADNENVQILETANYQTIFTLKTSQSDVSKISFSPDGQLLAIAGKDIELWDAWSGQPLSRVEDIDVESIRDLIFNSDGDGLLIAKAGAKIQHWKISRGLRAFYTSRPTPSSLPTIAVSAPEDLITIDRIADFGKGISSNVFYSPDGKIAAFMKGIDLVWFDTSTYKQLGTIEVGDVTGWLTFSPDGRLVVVDGYMGASIVDLVNQERLGGVSGGNGSTFGYYFSKDSQYMAYTMADRTTGGPYYAINVWSVVNRDIIGDYEYYPTLLSERYHVMSAPAISPNGRLVAAGHNDKRVYVWDLHSGETCYILEGHAGSVKAVAFSPDGSYLASGSSDGTIRLWNPSTGKLIRVLTGFLDGIYDISFSTDSRLLTVSVADHPDQIVNIQSGQHSDAPLPVVTPDPFMISQSLEGYSAADGSIFSSAAISSDGRLLAMAGQNVLLWNIDSGELITVLDTTQGDIIRGIAFSPDGKNLAVATECESIITWDIDTGKQIFSRKSVFLPGATVYFGIGDSELGPARGGSSIAEQGLAFSPNSKLLAFGNDNNIEVWDLSQSKLITTLVNPEGKYATQVSFSENGKRLYVILNRNREAQIWDLDSANLIKQVDLPDIDPNAYSAIALNGPLFARNNGQSAQGSWIELWNLETEKTITLGMPSYNSEPLLFSPDGSLLVAVNGSNVYFWKTSSGQLVFQNTLQDAYGSGMALSPDNKRMATVSYGQAQLWDVSKVVELALSERIPNIIVHSSATPPVFAWPTATPYPTVTTYPGAGDGTASIISTINAKQIQEISRFGRGTVENVTWAPSGDKIYVAGSMGIYQYDLQGVNLAIHEAASYEKDGWSYTTVALPDGRVLATGASDGRVFVRDNSSGKSLANLEGQGETAISGDGNLLAFFNPDMELQIWNIADQKTIVSLPSYYYDFRSPIFSPDGTLVAAIQTNSSRYDDSVRIWNTSTGEIVNALGGPDNNITDLSFSQDGRYITGAAGGSAWVWDVSPGIQPDQTRFYEVEIIDNLNVYYHYVTATALSPNNELLAIGTSDNTLQLNDRITHQKMRDLEGLSSPARQLRFSPDGKTLLSVHEDGLIILWDVASGKLISSLDKYLGNIGGLVFRSDGALSIWGTGTNWIVKPQDGNLIDTFHISNGKILAASPAGDLLAVYNPFQMSVWDARTEKLIQTLEGEAVMPFVDYQYEGSVFRQFYAAAFTVDGSRLVTAGAGGVWVYDTSDNSLIQQYEGSVSKTLAVSSDGNFILTSLYDYSQPISVYDLQTGDTVFTFDETGSGVYQAVFSPDGQWAGMVQGTWDGPYTMTLVNMFTDHKMKSIELGEEIPGISMAINPGSTLAAIGLIDGRILLVDLSDMQVLKTLNGHNEAVESLAFSPDGRYLTSGCIDGTVRIWGLP